MKKHVRLIDQLAAEANRKRGERRIPLWKRDYDFRGPDDFEPGEWNDDPLPPEYGNERR